MAVMFSGVPDNYDSVFGPLVYTLTGIASGADRRCGGLHGGGGDSPSA